jgi:MraZ protein
MTSFLGTYECNIDPKGRIMLPASIKKQVQAELGEGFVLKRSVFQNCLELYTMSEWNKLMESINKLNRFNQKNMEFIRRFNAGVKLVEVDANGRLLISKDLLEFAGIQKEVVVSSAVNVLEIWDKQAYEKAVNNSDIDFGSLAEEVMGGMNDV